MIDVSSPNYPSLMVNAAPAEVQDLVIGFSGSRCGSYVGAYSSWRHGAGASMVGPVPLKAGEDHFPEPRWGDYSCTSLDLEDGTLWTVQEYALDSPLPLYMRRWGTWIARMRPFD